MEYLPYTLFGVITDRFAHICQHSGTLGAPESLYLKNTSDSDLSCLKHYIFLHNQSRLTITF